MVPTSRSNSIGLVSNSSQPAAKAFSRSPPSACAEKAITGMSRVFWIALEPARGFPTVDDWHFQIHQNDVRSLSDRHLATSLAILRGHHLEITQ